MCFWSIWSSLPDGRRRKEQGCRVSPRIIGISREAYWREEVFWRSTNRLSGSSSGLDSLLAKRYGGSRSHEGTWQWQVSMALWVGSEIQRNSTHQRMPSSQKYASGVFQCQYKLRAFLGNQWAMKSQSIGSQGNGSWEVETYWFFILLFPLSISNVYTQGLMIKLSGEIMTCLFCFRVSTSSIKVTNAELYYIPKCYLTRKQNLTEIWSIISINNSPINGLQNAHVSIHFSSFWTLGSAVCSARTAVCCTQ